MVESVQELDAEAHSEWLLMRLADVDAIELERVKKIPVKILYLAYIDKIRKNIYELADMTEEKDG